MNDHKFIALPVINQPRPAYQQRVIDERSELSTKLERLDNFTRSDSFNLVPGPEQDRMTRQAHAMHLYRDVLNERIAAFD